MGGGSFNRRTVSGNGDASRSNVFQEIGVSRKQGISRNRCFKLSKHFSHFVRVKPCFDPIPEIMQKTPPDVLRPELSGYVSKQHHQIPH